MTELDEAFERWLRTVYLRTPGELKLVKDAWYAGIRAFAEQEKLHVHELEASAGNHPSIERAGMNHIDWAEVIEISVCLDAAVRQRDERLLRQAIRDLTTHVTSEVPLCAGHAQPWFTERNHLSGGMNATCVVCAFVPPQPALGGTKARAKKE